MKNNEKFLEGIFDAEVSMYDLITDIYAVNLAMYMNDHNFEMPEEFKEIGKQSLIARNIAFMSQHMQEIWCVYCRLVEQIQAQDGDFFVEPDLSLSDAW